MTSLNEDKGNTISELELTLRAIKHLLRQKAKEKPDGGLVMAKGKNNEIRLSWSDMVNVVDSLESKLGMEGCFSQGICKTCRSFNIRVTTGKTWGQCGTVMHHEYDSCPRHSKKGGGFGL